MTIPYWTISLLLTVLIWTAAILWPTGESGGGYNFGPAIRAALHLISAVIATLVVWLAFFVVF